MIGELVISGVLVVLLLVLVNPLGAWMPNALVMMLVALFVVVFALFAVFVWRERARDEREELHRMLAGRVGFLAGTGVMVLGIVFQSFDHAVDPWLAAALGLAVLAKAVGLLYAKSRY